MNRLWNYLKDNWQLSGLSGSHAPAWEPSLDAPASRIFPGSHAPAWEPSLDAPAFPWFLVPTRRRGNAFLRCRHRGPQARKDGTLARQNWIPTPARGNQKINDLRVSTTLMYNDERRRVGTRNPFFGFFRAIHSCLKWRG